MEVVDELVARIDPANPGSNRVVMRALKDATGRDMGTDPEAWIQWLANEKTWAQESAHEARVHASDLDPVVSTAGLREISEHPLFHRTLYPSVIPALHHESESVLRSACLALERLGDPGALEALVELLSDSRPAVKAAAHHALVSLSGQALPPLADAWSDWLRL